MGSLYIENRTGDTIRIVKTRGEDFIKKLPPRKAGEEGYPSLNISQEDLPICNISSKKVYKVKKVLSGADNDSSYAYEFVVDYNGKEVVIDGDVHDLELDSDGGLCIYQKKLTYDLELREKEKRVKEMLNKEKS